MEKHNLKYLLCELSIDETGVLEHPGYSTCAEMGQPPAASAPGNVDIDVADVVPAPPPPVDHHGS